MPKRGKLTPVNSRRRSALRLIAALAASVPFAVRAQEARTRLRIGIDYREIPPQPVPAGNAIEVIEFFWYGCPYCFQLEGPLDAWLQRKPPDVAFRRVPAIFRDSWLPHARIYFTLEALGALPRLHPAVYESYHLEQQPLNRTDTIADWAAAHGLDRNRWLAVYESSEVDSRILGARDALQRYGVTGTPSLVVDGRYLTSSAMTPGAPALIPVLDELIALARSQRVR